jgi:hypothetical protein
MASARQSKPTSPGSASDESQSLGGKRPEYVGIVEAPDQQSAEAAAVRKFKVSDEEAYTGREAEWARQEADLFAALREGRVVGGVDVHGK